MSGLSRRALFTVGLSRVLERTDAAPPQAPARAQAAAASCPPERPAARAWPYALGADLWAPAAAALPRPAGRDVLDLDTRDDVADLADLPFAEGSHDAVVCAFGPMFSSDGRAAIDELFRVVRPGGTVAFTAWTAGGAVARLLRLAAAHDPLPRGVPAPLAWGREERLRQELDRHGDAALIEARELTICFGSVDEAVERLVAALGPLALAPRQPELRAGVRQVVEELADADRSGIVLASRYLLVVAERTCPILTRSHAQDEDPLRRKEALQEDRERQDPCASRLHEPHSREEVAEEEALSRQAADPLRS